MQIRPLQFALVVSLITIFGGCEQPGAKPGNTTVQTSQKLTTSAQAEETETIASLDELIVLLNRSSNILRLDLQHSGISDNDLKHLSKLSRLEELNLPEKTSDDGLKHLSDLTGLRKLLQNRTSMESHDSKPITDVGLNYLQNLRALQTLSLPYAEITDEGLKSLANFPSLEILHVGSDEITDAGVPHLATLPSLRRLSLRATNVGDAGIKLIAKNHRSLEYLNLCHTKITSAAVDDLSKLSNLEWLGVYETPLNGSYPNKSDATAELERALPDTEILWID